MIDDYIFVTCDLNTITGHLFGFADGLRWHINDENKQALVKMIEMLRADAVKLQDVCHKIRMGNRKGTRLEPAERK